MNAVIPRPAEAEPVEEAGAMPEIDRFSDHEIADQIVDAVNKVQEMMDQAILAGLVVEPSFKRIENRLTQSGMRLDSFVCNIRVFRKLV